MKQKGFSLIELLIVVAILGLIAAVIIPNIGKMIEAGRNAASTNETAVTNTTIFEGLRDRLIGSLNLTELEFMVDYCLLADPQSPALEVWLSRAAIYQNQIIINELEGRS